MAARSAVFSTYSGPKVEVVPPRSSVAVGVSTETETEPLHFAEAGTQAILRADAGVQTDPVAAATQESTERALSSQIDAVAAFLGRVGGTVVRQLERNALSSAFDSFVPSVDEGQEESKCIAALDTTWRQEREDGAYTTALPVTALAWSATGSSLIAAFGAPGDVGWSVHHGGVAVWNVMKRDFDAASPGTSAPDTTIPLTTSVLSLAAHPTDPACVAGGTSVGEVVLWDLGREEPQAARSSIDEYVHREGVVGLKWVPAPGRSDFLLVSLSSDGRVAVWTRDNALEAPLHIFRVMPPRSEAGSRPTQLGGASLDALTGAQGALLVGTEGGSILRCTLPRTPPGDTSPAATAVRVPGGTLEWHPAAAAALGPLSVSASPRVVRAVETHAVGEGARVVTLPLLLAARPDPAHFMPSPAVFAHTGHSGPARAMAGSPFHRALFASGGADGSVGICSALLRSAPLLLEPVPASLPSSHVGALAWSTSRPLVLAVGSGDGMVHVFDLLAAPSAPTISLPPAAYGDVVGGAAGAAGGGGATRASGDSAASAGLVGPAGGGVLSLSFNPRLGKLLAVGDASGTVRLWRLGWRLAEPGPKEVSLLNTYMRALVQ